MQERISAKGVKFHVFSVEELEDADNNGEGFCVACGESASGVEPDARRYECESCGERRVYGAGELAMMGLVHT